MIKNFFRFIYWKWYDLRHPISERPYGISCYIGLPGTGKTLSLAYKLMQLKMQFPKAKIYTNFGFKYEDGAIETWHNLIDYKNDEGVIFGLDEVHSIWSRYESQKMPMEILELFSQNRKWSKQMVCTSQTYADIVVDIRRRCHFIIECRNIGKRWIFQRAFRPEDYKEKDGEYTARHRAWRLNFIADNIVYHSYDTYAVIESIARKYKQENAQANIESSKPSNGSHLSDDGGGISNSADVEP